MNKKEKVEYSKDDFTIVWQPKLCKHAGKCVGALPQAYNPKNKPWINVNNASEAEFIAQIKTCPSGALSYYHKSPQK